MLELSPVRAFSVNNIWLRRTPGDRAGAAVVDPGVARPVEEALEREGLRLRAISVTHHHPDHDSSVRELVTRYGGPVLDPPYEEIRCASRRPSDGERVNLSHRNAEAALAATRELRSRDEATLPSTIGLERPINPFLRCREPAVNAAARAGRPLSPVEEIYLP